MESSLRRTVTQILPLLAISIARLGFAGETRLLPESRLWLEGVSTLHPFASTATAMNMAFAWGPGAPDSAPAAFKAGAPASMTLTIPVAKLKSAHKGLDQNLQKTLKADKNPDLVFALRSYSITPPATLEATGDLTVAGVTKPQAIRATLRDEDGRAVVEGEHALLMTDFGIKPPTMMLGAVKVQDRIVVKFHLELKSGAGAPNAPKQH